MSENKATTATRPAFSFPATTQAPGATPATTAPKNQSAESAQQKAVAAMGSMLKAQFKAIESIVPKTMDPQRLARIALIEFQKNPKLMECTPSSVVGCVLQAAMLGLEIGGSLGYCYMIPYRDKGVMVAQFQVGYKGLLKKARDSGEIRHIDAGIVCQNDDYDFEKGLEPKCHVRFKFGQERGPVIGYYACASFHGGGSCFEVMTKNEVTAFARVKSKTFNTGAWQTDFDSMAIKTVIKRMSKWLPMNENMANAMNSDERVMTDKVDLDVGIVEVDATYVNENGETVNTETGELTSA